MKFFVKIAAVLMALLLGNEIITAALILAGVAVAVCKLIPAAAEGW